MDTQTSAQLAQATYLYGEKGKNRQKRIDNVNKEIEGTGYEIDAANSNRGVVTYRNKEDPTKIHIAHRGTKVDGRGGMKDLTSDLSIAFGLGGHDKQMKQRKRKTERIINKTGAEEVTMSGHSLGGGTMNYTIANSKKVRDKLVQADSYNGAANPVFDNDMKVNKKTKKELEGKVTHHRMKHDLVSKGFLTNTPFGKTKTYKLKKQHDESHNKKANEIIKNRKEIGDMGLTGRTLFSHHISHFTDRDLKQR